MASGGACLFFDNRAALLVAHHSTLSLGRAHSAMADCSLSVPRGHSEHRTLSFSHFLRACALSDLRDGPPHYESHPVRRSSGRGRDHVGRRFHFFSRSSWPGYHRAAEYSANAGLKKAGHPITCSIWADAFGQAGTIETCEVGFAFASIYRPASTLAKISALRPADNVPISGSGSSRWPVGATNGAHELGRRSTLDALARTDSVRLINSRKHLLFRLPVQLRARFGTSHPSRTLVLAAAFPFKVDRDLFIVAVLLGLRSVQLMGEPKSHGHVSDWLLRSRDRR